jgi:hypothetical protein
MKLAGVSGTVIAELMMSDASCSGAVVEFGGN